MPSQPTPAPTSTPLSWGVALAAASLLTVGGGALIWTHREPPEPEPSLLPGPPPDAGPQRRSMQALMLQAAAVESSPPALHSVSLGRENGNRVVKIKVVPDGDELIVDAATGRLLETRPSRPTAPPPMGKFAAPFEPMT